LELIFLSIDWAIAEYIRGSIMVFKVPLPKIKTSLIDSHILENSNSQ